MLPLILWAVKELAESEASSTLTQSQLAEDLKAKILSTTGLDKATILTGEEIDSLFGASAREVEAAVLAKIKATLA